MLKMHGLINADLARCLGVDPGQVTRWTQGRIPRGDELAAIAKVLKTTPETLLGSDFKEPLPPEPPPRRGPRPRSDRPVASEVAVSRAPPRRRTGT